MATACDGKVACIRPTDRPNARRAAVYPARVTAQRNALPEETQVLLMRQMAAKEPARYRPKLAAALHDLAVRLDQLGRPQDALLAADEAVDIYEELAETRPGTYQRAFALALNNLGVGLAGTGDHASALAVEQEAVDLLRARSL